MPPSLLPLAELVQRASDPQQSLLEAYGLIVMIAAIGLAAVVLVLSVIIARRMSRRRSVLLERAIQKRRSEQGPPPTTSGSRAPSRYVDPDRLSPEEIAQRAAEDTSAQYDNAADDDPDTGSTWDDAIAGEQDSDPGEDDPYGLFEDKPYVDPEEDEDEDDPGDGIDPEEPWR